MDPTACKPLPSLGCVFTPTRLRCVAGKVRIQIGCGTLDDTHLPTCRLFHEALLQHGVDHTCVTTPPNVLLPCYQQLAALISSLPISA